MSSGTINFSNKSYNTPSNDDKVINLTKVSVIIASLILIISFFVGGLLVSFLIKTYTTLPNPEKLAIIEPSLVTKVYGKDSTLIHEFSIERRFWAPIDEIPLSLQNAVIAIEDRRFRSHWGIDVKRIFGTIIVNITSRGYSQGASTLTQQLARNLYFTHDKTLMRKVREMLTAIKLESYYTKDEILELYLNQVYLGGGVYGVEAASQRYFSKSAIDLTLNESAVIAGLIQLPERYRPDRPKNIKRITVRRNSVIRGMLRAGFINKETYDSTKKENIIAHPYKPTGTVGPYFVEKIRQHLEKEYGDKMLYNAGLSIYTTLDPKAQIATEKAMIGHLDTLQRIPNRLFIDSCKAWRIIGISRDSLVEDFENIYKANIDKFKDLPDSLKLRKIQASVLAIDAQSGAVRVLIGGKNYETSKYNRALQSVRQPGSAFKPFVYTAAILKGYTPATIVIDKPITLQTSEGLWRPENYEKEFYGPMTIRNALKKSINLVAIQIFQDVGANEVISLARQMGLKHTLPPVPALAIGACEVTNMELTSAYSTFANGGVRAEPYFIEKVVDKKGKVLEQHIHKEEKILSPGVTSIMASMMSDVVNHGTAVRVRRYGFTRPAAGKTGTTNSYSDAWFVGYTPQIACGVWVGSDERRSMGRGVTGAKGAIPIWVAAMKELHRDLPVKKFPIAGDVVTKNVCTESHKIATKYCPSTYKEIFLSSRIPEECKLHGLNIAKDTNDVINFFGSGDKSQDKEKGKVENSGSNQLIF